MIDAMERQVRESRQSVEELWARARELRGEAAAEEIKASATPSWPSPTATSRRPPRAWRPERRYVFLAERTRSVSSAAISRRRPRRSLSSGSICARAVEGSATVCSARCGSSRSRPRPTQDHPHLPHSARGSHNAQNSGSCQGALQPGRAAPDFARSEAMGMQGRGEPDSRSCVRGAKHCG